MPVSSHTRGFTLLEMFGCLVLLVALTGLGVAGFSYWQGWRDARAANGALRAVALAQKMYLTDHPTQSVEDLTGTNLATFLTYLPKGELPQTPTYAGGATSISVTTQPPVITQGGGVIDPSGSPTDGLWDIGK